MSGIPWELSMNQNLSTLNASNRPTPQPQQLVYENGDHYDGDRFVGEFPGSINGGGQRPPATLSLHIQYPILAADVSYVAPGNFSTSNPSGFHLPPVHNNHQPYASSNSQVQQGFNQYSDSSFVPINFSQAIGTVHPTPSSFNQPVEQPQAAPAFESVDFFEDVLPASYERQLQPAWNSQSDGSQTAIQIRGVYPFSGATTNEATQTNMFKAQSNKGKASAAKGQRNKRSEKDYSHSSFATTGLADEDGEDDVAAAYLDDGAGEESAAEEACSEKTPMELIAEYQAVCLAQDPLYEVGETFFKDGKLCTKETASGRPALAKYLYEDICEKASQGRCVQFSAEGVTYDHPRKPGTGIAQDVTAFVEDHKDWSKERNNGRPSILLQLRCTDGRKGHKRPAKFDGDKDENGRVYLNPDGYPIRKLTHMPQMVSSVIPGWEMEAICRLNPGIGDLDFRDRMAPVIQKRWKTETVQMADGTKRKVKVLRQKDGRPTRQNLNMRRVRDRQMMRIPTWPEPKKKTTYDQKIEEEMDQWGIANNSTVRLADLDKSRCEALGGVTYLSVPKRAGTKALTRDERASQIEKAINKVKQGGFAENSNEVQDLRKRLLKIQNPEDTDGEADGPNDHVEQDSGEEVEADLDDMTSQTYSLQSVGVEPSLSAPLSGQYDVEGSRATENGDGADDYWKIDDFIDFDVDASLADLHSDVSEYNPLAQSLTSHESEFDPLAVAFQMDADLLKMSQRSVSSLPPSAKRQRADEKDAQDPRRPSKRLKNDGTLVINPSATNALAFDPFGFKPFYFDPLALEPLAFDPLDFDSLAFESQAVDPLATSPVTPAHVMDAAIAPTSYPSSAIEVAPSTKRPRGDDEDANDAEQCPRRAKQRESK